MDGDAAVIAGNGDHGLPLNVELLLVTDPIRALDHVVGLGHRPLDVAAPDRVVGELAR